MVEAGFETTKQEDVHAAGTAAVRRFTPADADAVIADLQRMSVDDLDVLFGEGTVPSFREIEGRTAGGWLAKRKDYWWARLFIRAFLASPWARWTGKGLFTPFDRGEPGRGANLFDNRIRPVRYRLATYVKTAEVDENPCLALEYPFGSIMWGLIDDVRSIDDGVFLGQMQFRFPWQRRRLFLGYFVLCALRTG